MEGNDHPRVLALVERLQRAIQRRDRPALAEGIAELVALDAPMGEQWESLAYIAMGYGEIRLARDAIDRLVAASGGSAVAQYRKAAFLALLGAWADADAVLRALPQTVPDPVSNAFSRGIAALNLGRLAEARACLEQVSQQRPQWGVTWFSLAMTVDFSTEPKLTDRLIAAGRGMERAPVGERVPYHYALGKALNDLGEDARAFAAFAQGAREMHAATPYDREADRAQAERVVEGYSAERIAAIAARQSEPTDRTIFVTGLPRSGSTLVEQILTSHSAVVDGGEIARLLLLDGDVGGADYAALARYVDAGGTAQAARSWSHWLDELFPAPGRIVDKSLNSSRFLGLAAALLPDAPLVWLTRDPLDCAWSCFRTNFSGAAMPWSYDLADIAAHFRLEDRLLSQWRQLLGDRLLVVPYEELVTEPDAWIRRILAHCGLAEEPQVFAPHENARPVPTASMVQVRRPIHRAAIGAAEPYRDFLGPFIEAYRS